MRVRVRVRLRLGLRLGLRALTSSKGARWAVSASAPESGVAPPLAPLPLLDALELATRLLGVLAAWGGGGGGGGGVQAACGGGGRGDERCRSCLRLRRGAAGRAASAAAIEACGWGWSRAG